VLELQALISIYKVSENVVSHLHIYLKLNKKNDVNLIVLVSNICDWYVICEERFKYYLTRSRDTTQLADQSYK